MFRRTTRRALAPLAVVVAAAVLLPMADSAGAPGDCTAPTSRRVRVTEPSSLPTSLLVALHGYGSSGARLAAASDLEARAAAAGARVVLPDGSGEPRRWALAGRLPAGDDVAYVSGLVERCRPPGGRVVLAGFSNGAAFAAELACALGPRVDALLLVGGAGVAAPCPDRVAPTVVVHGGADRVVPVTGGPVLGGRLQARPLAEVDADRVVIVPGWGHTWPPTATDEAIRLVVV